LALPSAIPTGIHTIGCMAQILNTYVKLDFNLMKKINEFVLVRIQLIINQ